MRLSDIQLLFDYHYWTLHLMLAKATELTSEQYMAPSSFSWGSLHGTLVHTLDSDNMWRQLLQTQIVPPRLATYQSFPALESVIEAWQDEEQKMRAYINGLGDSDMDRIIRYETPEGVRERVLWHCLVHMVNHGTQHFSECAAMLTDFGCSPGGIDMTLYLNMRAAAK